MSIPAACVCTHPEPGMHASSVHASPSSHGVAPLPKHAASTSVVVVGEFTVVVLVVLGARVVEVVVVPGDVGGVVAVDVVEEDVAVGVVVVLGRFVVLV